MLLHIKPVKGERLGSYLRSIKNALHVAFHLRVNIKIDNNNLKYVPKFIRINEDSSEEILYEHTFFGYKRICKDLGIEPRVFEQNERLVQEKMQEIIKLPRPDKTFGANDLYIHMRSGDIFLVGGFSALYVPPPLIFYMKAISAKPWDNIRIICEDQENPMLSFLLAKYPRITWKQQSLEEDIRLIVGAVNIAYGGGTFVSGLLIFNQDLRSVYRVSYSQPPPKGRDIAQQLFPCEDYVAGMGGRFTGHPRHIEYAFKYGIVPVRRLQLL